MWQIYGTHVKVENVWTHAGITGTQPQARKCKRHAIKLHLKIFCTILVLLEQGCPTFFYFCQRTTAITASWHLSQISKKITIIGIP
jgi:hypothetical protein